MAVSNTSAHPIQTLREHILTLEATITLTLAEPHEKTVHRLRTTTRRIEGQLAMLELLPGIPEHEKIAREARRSLRKLRRAAGEVRDIDVQFTLIEQSVPQNADRKLRSDAKKLTASLERDRARHARRLVKLLKRKQAPLALTLESLLEVLEPNEDLALTPTRLNSLAETWFRENTPAGTSKEDDDPDHLHAIRKVAKLARYIAENGPKAAKAPRRLAQSFEDLQQSGGEWHDWLVLANIAEDRLGAKSPLTIIFRDRSRTSLTAYRRRLNRMAV
jgi:CHAD domain-containing protein